MRDCPVRLNRKRELASISHARTAAFDPPVAAGAIPIDRHQILAIPGKHTVQEPAGFGRGATRR